MASLGSRGAVFNAVRAPAARHRKASLAVWIAGAAGLLIAQRLPQTLWPALEVHAAWPRIAGAGLLIAATGFTLWSRWVLGTMWTVAVVAKEGHELRTQGPYGITRHPIYTGLLGMLLGTALMRGLGIWAAYFAIALAVLFVKLSIEERLLLETFGQRYAEYRKRTPQLVPGLKR